MSVQTGLARDRSRLLPVAALGLFVVVLLSRKPWLLVRPEFWSDDGWEWYPDALHLGIACLVQPVNGYLNSLQRLVALATAGLSLLWVARVYAAVGIVVQAGCGAFLCSRRLDAAWPDVRARLLFALLAMLLPNEAEFYGNLTNAQWSLAVLACLVVCGSAPRTTVGWGFDTVVLLLAGLSGPFAPLLLVVAAARGWQGRSVASDRRATLWRGAILLGCAAVQGALVLSRPNHAALPTPLGASPVWLAQILFRQVLAGVEFGYASAAKLPYGGFFGRDGVALSLTIVGVVLFAVALRRGPALFTQFSLFALLVALAGLAQPHASVEMPQWHALARPPCGNRYFTMLSVAWLGAVLVLLRQREWALWLPGVVLFGLLVVFGLPRGWRVPNWHTDFADRARAWATAPPGSVMRFDLIPPSDHPMILVRP